MNKKVLFSKHYNYPTRKEREKLALKTPKYLIFDFKQINIASSILNKAIEMNEVERIDNLYYLFP